MYVFLYVGASCLVQWSDTGFLNSILRGCFRLYEFMTASYCLAQYPCGQTGG